jgi:Mg-chelatase subunit ChlD
MYHADRADANVIKPVKNPTTDPSQHRSDKIEVVFILDTTSSMGGMIEAAKEKIWSIASTMASAQSAPRIKMGLVAFRDRGDDYITKVIDLSDDLDSMYAQLMDFQALGGGDTPESVNQALYDAVHKVSWSQDENVYQVIFLVGDAPPHADYQNDVPFADSVNEARTKGIVVNAIQCGDDGVTLLNWQQIAQLGGGGFFQVGQEGSAIAVNTPFDKKLAELSKELDDTRLYFGSPEVKEEMKKKRQAANKLHAAASEASRARRATFNASKSGKANLLGEDELVDAVASGRVDLSQIEREQLPEPLQTLAPAKQQELIAETAQKRQKLEIQIDNLARQRARFLQDQVSAKGTVASSLDEKIYSAVRDQAFKKGFVYEAGAAAY